MNKLKRLLPLLILAVIGHGCNKDIDINNSWKEITVVYGLLNVNDSINYLKITKAFLGDGNAMQYAQIPDSSNFYTKLDVRVIEYDNETALDTIVFDTTTVTNKDSGVFYYPSQKVYYTKTKFNQAHQYKLLITNKESGTQLTSETGLVHAFSVTKPQIYAQFEMDKLSTVEWNSAANGKRYQLMIRFWYYEYPLTNPDQKTKKYVDWVVFNDIESDDTEGGEEMKETFLGNGFYQAIKANVEYDASVGRLAADTVQYFFSVASQELSYYMDVTNPSNTIVQERPEYSNIENGIGLFSSRIINIKNLLLSDKTKTQLYNGSLTDSLF